MYIFVQCNIIIYKDVLFIQWRQQTQLRSVGLDQACDCTVSYSQVSPDIAPAVVPF